MDKGKLQLINSNRKHLGWLILAGLLIASGCKKEEAAAPVKPAEQQPQPQTQAMPPDHSGMSMEMGAGHGPATPQPKTTKEIVISDDIRQKYAKVSVSVTDKATGKTNSYSVTPNSEFAVPNTDLKLQIGEFVPDFSMTSNQIISKSADLNNPGLQVKIYEGPEQKYDGWLFANFPEMHAFEHNKYGITLAKLESGK